MKWIALILIAQYLLIALLTIASTNTNEGISKLQMEIEFLKERDDKRLQKISNDTILRVSDIVEEAFKHERLIAVSKDLLIAIEENRGTEVEIQNGNR